MISINHSRPGVTLGLLLLLPAAACWGEMDFERTEVSEQTYPASAIRIVSLENRNGRIHLQAWGRDEIQVKATKKVKGWGMDKAEEILKQIKVELIHEGETLTIRTALPNHWRRWGRSASVQYEIKLPRRMNVEATSTNGRIFASGLEGKQRYSSANGKIQVQGSNSPWQKSSRHSTVPASRRTALRFGHIHPVCSRIAPCPAGAGTVSVLARLSPRTGKGSLEAETVNGAVEIDGAIGVLEAQTKNGSIRTQNIRGRLRAKTINGSVRASFSTPPDGEVALKTTNGSVRLTLPAQTHANVVGRTANGSIASDFPLMVQGKIGKKLEGKLGEGGPPMTHSTVNGSIRISRLE